MNNQCELDIVLKLREARRIAGLTQEQVARRAFVSHQLVSSFETGRRIHSMKLAHLEQIANVCGFTLIEFLQLPVSALETAPRRFIEPMRRKLDPGRPRQEECKRNHQLLGENLIVRRRRSGYIERVCKKCRDQRSVKRKIRAVLGDEAAREIA